MKNALLLSLWLNVALILAGAVLLLRPASDLAPGQGAHARVSSGNAKPVTTEVSAREASLVGPPPSPPELGEMDHQEQVAALVAAGWSSEDAKVFALGRVLRESMELLMGGGDSGDNYWEDWGGPDLDWETQREMMEMQHRVEAAIEDLFGGRIGGMYGAPEIPLPPEKVQAARIIQQDYQMMQMKIHADNGGVMLPEDHEALALLAEEKRQDLEAILSPEELFEYEVRSSSTAMTLRNRLAGMRPTEEEFRKIFRLQREVDQMGGLRLDGADEETRRRHAEATENMQRQLQEVLGEERYRQYQRSQDWGYSQLSNVAKRLDLPPERVDLVYDVKDYAEDQLRKIRQDRDLSNEERKEALSALGDETREDLKGLLGEQGLEIYQRQGGHWIHQLP